MYQSALALYISPLSLFTRSPQLVIKCVYVNLYTYWWAWKINILSCTYRRKMRSTELLVTYILARCIAHTRTLLRGPCIASEHIEKIWISFPISDIFHDIFLWGDRFQWDVKHTTKCNLIFWRTPIRAPVEIEGANEPMWCFCFPLSLFRFPSRYEAFHANFPLRNRALFDPTCRVSICICFFANSQAEHFFQCRLPFSKNVANPRVFLKLMFRLCGRLRFW